MNYCKLLQLACVLLCAYINQSVRAEYTVDTTKFASKNAYVSSSTDDERLKGRLAQNVINSYCKPLQVSAVLRHGTRNPIKRVIKDLNSVLAKFKKAGLNNATLQPLADIAAQFPLKTEGELVQTGKMEHQMIGYRTAETYQDLFSKVGLNDLSFSATSKSRAVDSCKAFQEGFFSLHNRSVAAPIVTRNDILRFYDTCDKYTKLVANKSSQAEYTTFQNAHFPQIIRNYVNELQIPSANLDNEEMASVYQVGAMEYAGLNSTNWAQYIKPQDMLTLEYSSDIKLYYKFGYGYPINYQMSCPLLSKIFHDMDKVFNGSDYMKGLFYFAHAETVAPLFDILGLFKDPQPLTASNYDQQTNRQFRTGRIVSFASNIAFVQYDCDLEAISQNISQIPAGIFPTQPQRNMTLVLVKEAPIRIPVCDALMCPYSTIRKNYTQSIDNCNYNSTCDNLKALHSVSGHTKKGSLLSASVATTLPAAFKIIN